MKRKHVMLIFICVTSCMILFTSGVMGINVDDTQVEEPDTIQQDTENTISAISISVVGLLLTLFIGLLYLKDVRKTKDDN